MRNRSVATAASDSVIVSSMGSLLVWADIVPWPGKWRNADRPAWHQDHRRPPVGTRRAIMTPAAESVTIYCKSMLGTAIGMCEGALVWGKQWVSNRVIRQNASKPRNLER